PLAERGAALCAAELSTVYSLIAEWAPRRGVDSQQNSEQHSIQSNNCHGYSDEGAVQNDR
ncbi:hypothetical protein QDZ74_004504, partial [Pluralibacter gergoviae]